ncbi:proline dehydrogenase/delta-1-pyrroline-5-carboxylate dehydrogenase, partial [mine drainage metagenome]
FARAHPRGDVRAPNAPAVAELRETLLGVQAPLQAARAQAIAWVHAARAHARSGSLVESLLAQFSLDSAEGKALMSLAEALLRTPDALSADRLIAERLAALRTGGRDASLKVRLGLALLRTAGRALPDARALFTETPAPRHLLAPATRRIMRHAMRLMGHAFIVGESIE